MNHSLIPHKPYVTTRYMKIKHPTPRTDAAEKFWGEMPGMFRAIENELTETRYQLESALHFIADLNGCEWITDPSPAGIDMRQRAKAVHARLSKLVYHDYPSEETKRLQPAAKGSLP